MQSKDPDHGMVLSTFGGMGGRPTQLTVDNAYCRYVQRLVSMVSPGLVKLMVNTSHHG